MLYKIDLPCRSATCAVHGNGLSSIYEQSPRAKIFDEPFTFNDGSTKIWWALFFGRVKDSIKIERVWYQINWCEQKFS